VILSYGNKLARDLHMDQNTKDTRHFPQELRKAARQRLISLDAATTLGDLRSPGNHLEKLSGKLAKYHSVRINDQWRMIFQFEHGNASDVSITDYH
jgi:proteic killer suppression protein